jgi:hypothetical protein
MERIMKHSKYLIILVVLGLLAACKKDTLDTYSNTDNIRFNYKPDTLTTITYSFAYNPSLAKDTVWVPVSISGNRASHDRKFILSLVDTLTTAIASLHYEALKPFYIMPADSGTVSVPVVLKNTDEALASKSVALTLRLANSADFTADLPGSSSKNIHTITYVFSNRLEKPSWWVFWQSSLGEYSRVKHQLFLIASGTVDLIDPTLPNAFLQIPRVLYYLDNTRIFFKDPFAWVARYPEKGYVLTKRTDGSKDYDFYNSSSPEKKFLVRYYAEVNGYFFVDENGKQIVM